MTMYNESPHELSELKQLADQLIIYHLQYKALKWRSADQSFRAELPVDSYKELQPLEDAYNELVMLKQKVRIELFLLHWRKKLGEWSEFLAILASLHSAYREIQGIIRSEQSKSQTMSDRMRKFSRQDKASAEFRVLVESKSKADQSASLLYPQVRALAKYSSAYEQLIWLKNIIEVHIGMTMCPSGNLHLQGQIEKHKLEFESLISETHRIHGEQFSQAAKEHS